MIFKRLFGFDMRNGKDPRTVSGNNIEISIPALNMFVVTDLHSCYYEDMEIIREAMEENDFDCVLFLGDIFREDVEKIVGYANEKPCYYALGNHDGSHQNENIQGLENIDGEVIDINGVCIAGLSCGPRYKSGDYAMRTEKEMEEIANKLGRSDILVSHESPYHFMSETRSHGGFKAISDYISRIQPQLHIFGHHHDRFEGTYEKTKEICIYKCAIISTSPFSIKYVL